MCFPDEKSRRDANFSKKDEPKVLFFRLFLQIRNYGRNYFVYSVRHAESAVIFKNLFRQSSTFLIFAEKFGSDLQNPSSCRNRKIRATAEYLRKHIKSSYQVLRMFRALSKHARKHKKLSFSHIYTPNAEQSHAREQANSSCQAFCKPRAPNRA